MIRGWRNDPAWLRYREAVLRERLEREIERVKLEVTRSSLEQDIAALKERMRSSPFYGTRGKGS